MSHVLFSVTPVARHVRPALELVRVLVAAGHEVRVVAGDDLAAEIIGSGAEHVLAAAGVRPDVAGIESPTVASGAPTHGSRRPRWNSRRDLVRPIRESARDLDEHVSDQRPDVIVSDAGWIAGPLVARHHGIPVVVFTDAPASFSGRGIAPFGLGVAPSSSAPRWLRSSLRGRVVTRGSDRALTRAARRVVDELGYARPTRRVGDWTLELADRYLHMCLPSLEYPRADAPETYEVVGPLMSTGSEPWAERWVEPHWWSDVSAARAVGRPVVLVARGATGADPDRLVRTVIDALEREDLLVVVTSDGAEPESVVPAATRPANVRIDRSLPFDRVLADVDLVVMHGDLGGVQQVLVRGVPLLVVGTDADSVEVGARVAWAGVGHGVRFDRPQVAQVLAGVRRVLADPRCAERAAALAIESVACDGLVEVTHAIVRAASPTAPRDAHIAC